MKKVLLKLQIILLLIFPVFTYAYSDKIIVSGETIGIEVRAKGIYIVGFYEVNGNSIAKEAGFLVGDVIKKINNTTIVDISSLNNVITEAKEYQFTVLRNNHESTLKMTLEEENSVIKTGLYVKDQIKGIGTLSYIDPNTKIFGSLGHEIIESSSFEKFDIKDGSIYKAEVTAIKKSVDGVAGEKKATIDLESEIGNISKNEYNGIFGKYTDLIADDSKLYEVGSKEDTKIGKATIKTVIKDNNVEEYDINILAIDKIDSVKNILFEITDSDLIKETGGIIQGMSGSPIIQNDKIIGVVNYVIVDETTKGYGIFITTMLEEGDKILS